MQGEGGTYQQRRRWSDRYIQQQAAILAGIHGCTSDQFQISNQSDDFGGIDLWTAEGLRIGLRVRSAANLMTHPDEFTVRLVRDPHGLHEHDKLRLGHVDEILHCHADEDRIVEWKLLDADVFRLACEYWFSGVRHEFHEGRNEHGVYRFMAHSISSYDRYGGIVLASG